MLMILLSVVAYTSLTKAQVESPITVFIVDTKVDFSFVNNLTMVGEINHGSVVGRIIYQEVPEINLLSYGVKQEGEISKTLYYDALRKIANYQQQHPHERIIVNVSLGFSQATTEHRTLINNLVKKGVVVVAAGGNESSQQAIYPAGFKETVAVGNATTEGKAASSNYGEFIDICAPGDVKYISRLYLPQGVTVKSFKAVGTSFSAPRVVALLAELLTMQPNLSPSRALDLIKNNAEKISDPKYEQGLLGTGVINRDKTLAQVDSYYYFKNYVFSYCWILLILGIAIYWLKSHHWGILFLIILLILVVLPILILIQEIILGNTQLIVSSYQNLQTIDWFYLIAAFFIIIKLTSWNNSFVVFNYLLGIIGLSIGGSTITIFETYSLFYWRSGLLLLVLLFVFSEKWRIYQAKRENDINKLVILLSSYSQEVFRQAKYNLKKGDFPLQPLLKVLSQNDISLQVVKEIVITKNKKDKIVEKLFSFLTQRDKQVEGIVIEILSQLDKETVLNEINRLLTDSKPLVQYKTLRLLARLKIQDEELVQKVITILFSKSDMWLRYQALITLTAMSSSLKDLASIISELRFDDQEIIRLEAQTLWSRLEN